MVAITLPDGSVRSFDGPVTGTDIAESISKSLAKKAIAMKVDGALADLFAPVDQLCVAPVVLGPAGECVAAQGLDHIRVEGMVFAIVAVLQHAP